MKKYVLLSLICVLASCVSSVRQEDFRCPRVVMPAEKAYMTQIVHYADNFRIELTGYEGYCYIESDVARRYAVITPQFRVTRLNDNDETTVDFEYFTEIVQGPPEFVGKQRYFASAQIGKDVSSVMTYGRPVKVKIPLDNDDIEVILGLDISAASDDYNRSTFAPVSENSFQPAELQAVSKPVPTEQSSDCDTCALRRLFN